MDSWILQMIRRSLVRQLVAWTAAASVVGFLYVENADYVRGFVKGPRTLQAADLDKVTDPDGSPRYFVKVDGSRTVETGIQEYEVKTENGVEVSRTVSSVFYGLAVGSKYLIVKSPGGIQNPVEGTLDETPSEFEQRFFRPAEMKALRDRFYPFYLNAGSFRTGGYWALAGTVAFLVLLIWKAVPALNRFRNPESHPVMARVLTWGEPVSISAVIERELETMDVRRGGGWALTNAYLVRRSFFGFDVLRFHDLIWAYKKVTKHSVNFIPTGKTYVALMICYGGSAEVAGSEKKVDELLQLAARRAPWAFVGYSDELASVFKKNQPGFCAAVEERRTKASPA